MQDYQKDEEKNALREALKIEDLLEKKTKIYSRLLTDTALAKDLEGLSARHKARKESLLALLGEKSKKDGGMDGLKSKEDGE